MADAWYIMRDQQRRGPATAAQLKQLATSGQIQPATLVWKEGMREWKTAGSVRGLFAVGPPPAPAAPPIIHPGGHRFLPASRAARPSSHRVLVVGLIAGL